MKSRRLPPLFFWMAGLLLAVLFLANAGRLLEVNAPQPADAIVVLNGGTWARIATGLQLLRRGYAPRLLLDTDPRAVVWGVPEPVLAQHWIAGLPAPEPAEVMACPSAADSTRDEAIMAQPCLGAARRVLIVTSAYHTRRALEVFRRVDPRRRYFAAAVTEPDAFGFAWWRHRPWAKTTATEWGKLLWWEGVDRWRPVP